MHHEMDQAGASQAAGWSETKSLCFVILINFVKSLRPRNGHAEIICKDAEGC